MKVKSTATTYAGHDYQTLQGVYLLAQWLNSPTRYKKVAFNADQEKNETPQGIDDIVCVRPDGIRDFWQVKFTPSPEKEENQLTWNWLLNIPGRTKRSRSILKKLNDAVSTISADKLGDVVLLTNKRPDRMMENCIQGEKINFSKIDVATQQRIIEQLGNQEIAVSFFSKLRIQHSKGDYNTLSRSVISELLKHSDKAGINRLINRSKHWAMFEKNPSAEGWIYIHHVRKVLSPKRPEPISENFSVPPQYCLPDEDFHKHLVAQITSSCGEVITLTGNPGLGKSTYLSFLCQSLENQDTPLIRHHYFLSLGDTTEDRLSPKIVAESLLDQINIFYKEANENTSQPENLREALKGCAKFYKNKNKPFVVLIDGLDHVWRDNARNKKPLDETFRQLLPVVDNMVLLIGTQPIDDNLLPDLLLLHSPKNDWKWLPAMTGNSIYEFLKYQVDSDPIRLNRHPDHIDEGIKESAQKLLEITNGYPLHVIYSSEYLAQNNKPLSSREIEELPPCSDNNIETYYRELWKSLDYKQRDVLHLCSGFQFAWPRNSISLVLEDETNQPPSVDAVSHMLFEGISGVRPFHESLVVFVKNQASHQDRIDDLLSNVCIWLDTKAPRYLKDAWLWSSKARAGDPSDLRQGLCRDWILDRLVEGFPVKTCLRLLSEAGTYAFKEFNFAEADKHEALKTRLLDGPELQISDLPNLTMYSLVTSEESSLNDEISGQNESSPTKLAILATTLWHRGNYKRATSIAKKAFSRYKTKDKLFDSGSRPVEEIEAFELVKAGVLTGTLDCKAIFEKDIFSNWPDGYVSTFENACILKNDLDLLVRAQSALPPESPHADSLERTAIRTSIIEGADITSRPEYSSFSSQKLSSFLDTLRGKSFSNVRTYYPSPASTLKLEIEDLNSHYNWFFSSLCMRLKACGDFSWLPVSAKTELTDISAHFDLLNNLADQIAEKLLSGNPLTFSFICSLLPSEPLVDQAHQKTRGGYITLKKNWVDIASDCHLLTTKSKISLDELTPVIDSGVFGIDWLRTWYRDKGLKLLSDDAAAHLINMDLKRQSEELKETTEFSNGNLELVEIAYRHNDSSLFTHCLRRTWDFVLGYRDHKDSTIFDVLNAIEYIAPALPDEAIRLLETISPIIYNISSFTDGDETSDSKHSISSLLARLNPQTAASIYDQQLNDGEWDYSEETILRLIEDCDFSSLIIRHLFLTGLHSSCYQLLQKEVDVGNQSAIEISQRVYDLLGIKLNKKPKENISANTDLENIDIDPSKYPPERLQELINALSGKYNTSDFWKTWYRFWCEAGKEFELVENLLPVATSFSDRFDEKCYLLDDLFQSQKKLKGETKAFELLVAAHNAMDGWSGYTSTENSLNRLGILARTYPKRINEFIELTTIQPDRRRDKIGTRIVPDAKLVYLLTKSGRTDEALEVVNTMVDSLSESVRNLSLNKPKWDWGRDDTVEEALSKTLVSRLKLPIPSIKLWVIEQISELLINQHPNIENLIIRDLATRMQESECVEVLSLILIAKDKGYLPPSDLGKYINARSTLSDMILKDINADTSKSGSYKTVFSHSGNLFSSNHKFDDFYGLCSLQFYNSLFKREERRIGTPFTAYFRSELNNTFDYCPESVENINYFFGLNQSRNVGQFYTEASHRGKSAFLRTIEIAKRFYRMPDNYDQCLSIPALPIEPAYIGLIPKKPEWLLSWRPEIPFSRESLTSFIKQSIDSFDSNNESFDLAAFSLPMKIDDNTWADLTVLRAITDLIIPTKLDFDERTGLCTGSLLERTLSYKFTEEDQSKISILADITSPSMRYGNWHADLETRGLYVPKCLINGKAVTGESKNEYFSYSVDGVTIGYSSYWNNNWQPIYPKGVRSLCGTFTAVAKANYPTWLQPITEKTKYFYVCKAKILTSKNSYREFKEQELEFIIPGAMA